MFRSIILLDCKPSCVILYAVGSFFIDHCYLWQSSAFISRNTYRQLREWSRLSANQLHTVLIYFILMKCYTYCVNIWFWFSAYFNESYGYHICFRDVTLKIAIYLCIFWKLQLWSVESVITEWCCFSHVFDKYWIDLGIKTTGRQYATQLSKHSQNIGRTPTAHCYISNCTNMIQYKSDVLNAVTCSASIRRTIHNQSLPTRSSKTNQSPICRYLLLAFTQHIVQSMQCIHTLKDAQLVWIKISLHFHFTSWPWAPGKSVEVVGVTVCKLWNSPTVAVTRVMFNSMIKMYACILNTGIAPNVKLAVNSFPRQHFSWLLIKFTDISSRAETEIKFHILWYRGAVDAWDGCHHHHHHHHHQRISSRHKS